MTFYPPEQSIARHGDTTVPDITSTLDVPTAVPTQPGPQSVRPGTRTELVVKRGPDAGAGYAVTQSLTTIGRHRDCDIVLDDGTVSRYHAELRREQGRYMITDAGSLNGTYLNRRPVDHAELTDGDELWIGKFRFTFRMVG
jgi:pSer/pThr/pTyr-binding forkhead associated (FHA) protein